MIGWIRDAWRMRRMTPEQRLVYLFQTYGSRPFIIVPSAEAPAAGNFVREPSRFHPSRSED